MLLHSYFTKSSVLEHLTFGARTVIQRTAAGTRQSVNLTEKAANHVVHTYVRNDGLSAVIVTQKDYAERVAYSLLNKTMSDWDALNLESSWKKSTSDSPIDQAPESMKKDILLYQKPAEADKLLQIQKHLISIKEIMHKNIGATLTSPAAHTATHSEAGPPDSPSAPVRDSSSWRARVAHSLLFVGFFVRSLRPCCVVCVLCALFSRSLAPLSLCSDEVLKRGETIDNLMDKSADLSSSSKIFYKKSKGGCCK